MFYIGIDPGITGAVAILDHEGIIVQVVDMPVMGKGKGKQQINPAALGDLVNPFVHMAPCYAALERVSAMPGQGVSSMFSMGDSYGCIRGVLGAYQIPVEIVTPQTWKRHFRLDSDKERSRAKAIELFPSAALARKKDHGRAEALLLAKYLMDSKVRKAA
jgi:crossover junction endodeoxyribonuclease RuvC